MKGIVWLISLVICAFLGMRMWGLLVTSILQAHATQQFELGFDDFFSVTTRAQISDYVNQQPTFKKLSCSAVIAALLSEFPCIAHAVAVKKSCGTVVINLTAHKPWRCLNGELILCETGAVFPSEIFAYEFVKDLPCVNVASQGTTSSHVHDSCCTFLARLSPRACRQFDVAWISETKSLLRDKSQPLFSIMINNDQGLTNELLHACDRIKQDLQGKGLFKGARARQWFADLRFKNQIIVYAQKKGEQ